MKTKLLLMVFLVTFMSLVGEAAKLKVSDSLITAIMQVESELNAKAIGDGGRAIGMAQIHKICINDVNRIEKIVAKQEGRKPIRFKYSDRKSPSKSRQIMKIYLSYYGLKYEKNTGLKATPEILSKIWNGGPNGWKKQATIAYWIKVRNRLYT